MATLLCRAALCCAGCVVLWQTTLMDVLACRKTAGRTTGDVWVSVVWSLLVAACAEGRQMQLRGPILRTCLLRGPSCTPTSCAAAAAVVQVGGFPQEQHTFARICGYVEQSDIHSPRTTVREALVVSATLR